MRVLTQPTPSTPTSTAPAPTVATVSTQTSTARSTAESVPVTVYKLATGQFAEVPNQKTRPQNEGSNPPPLEYIPHAPPRQSTPWPNSGSTFENLLETRKDWLIPPSQQQHLPQPSNRRSSQSCSHPPCHVNAQADHREMLMGPHWPICKNEEEHKEDWYGNMQNQP